MSKEDVLSESVKSESKKEATKIRRVPVHTQKQQVFSVDPSLIAPGYKPMWIKDLPGDIDMYLKAGWEFVMDPTKKIKSNDGQIQFESRMDSVVRVRVNLDPNAPCQFNVLMQIPMEYYEEDCAAEQAEIDRKELGWNKATPNIYGEVTISNQHYTGKK